MRTYFTFGFYFENFNFCSPECPCWWDLSKVNCACCKGENVMQCGWPMHKFCYKKSKIVRKDILIYLIILIFFPHRAALEFATTSTLCQAKDSLVITTSQSKNIQVPGFWWSFVPIRGNSCAVCTKGAFQCYADDTTGPDSAGGSRCIGNTSEYRRASRESVMWNLQFVMVTV